MDNEVYFVMDTWSSQSLPVTVAGVQQDIRTNKSQFADYFTAGATQLEALESDEALNQQVADINRHLVQGDVVWRRCPSWLLKVR